LMTSLITILVMIPVAFAPKTGLDAYQPLGTTILGGLFVGTILSLLDIPIMHTYVDDFIRRLNKTFLHRDWTWPINTDDETELREIHDAALEPANGATNGAAPTSIATVEARH